MYSSDASKTPARMLRSVLLATCVLLSGGLGLSCGDGGSDSPEEKPDPGKDNEKVAVTSISLDSESESLAVGKTLQLTATLKPDNATDKTVTWNSDRTDIASVSSTGLVTGKTPGVAYISATASSGHVAKCEVIVFDDSVPQTIEVTSVTVSPGELEINVGGTYKLTATVAPDNATDKTVYWRSSSTSTASVASDGTVTANKAGTATITAYCNTAEGEVKGTCTVTVVQKVTSITLNRTEAHLTVGNILYLEATVAPENSPSAQSLVWASTDDSVASVDQNGKVTALKAGTADITASADGVSGKCTVTVEDISGGNEGTGDENWK